MCVFRHYTLYESLSRMDGYRCCAELPSLLYIFNIDIFCNSGGQDLLGGREFCEL